MVLPHPSVTVCCHFYLYLVDRCHYPVGQRFGCPRHGLTFRFVRPAQQSRWLALETGTIKPQGLAGHTTSVRAIAIGPDGRVYSGASDDTTRVWSCEDGVHLQTLEGHTLPVRSLAVTNDGRIYSGSADKTIRTQSPDNRSLHVLLDLLQKPLFSLMSLLIALIIPLHPNGHA